MVFGTSFGALIALDLAASAPAAIDTLIVHEPPLGQLLASEERQSFDLNLDNKPEAASALNAIAASMGDYHLYLDQLDALARRIIVTGSEKGEVSIHQCSLRLAEQLVPAGIPCWSEPGRMSRINRSLRASINGA